MRAWIAVLAAGSLVRRLRLHKETGRFETLEECEKAYEELLEKAQVTVEPDYAEEKPVEDTTTAAPTTTTTTTTIPRPMKHGEVGHPDHKDAAPAYHPPTPFSGKPSEEKGWDYGDHGADWAEAYDGSECGSTSGQSPIDIVKYIDIKGQTKSVLWFDYYVDPKLDSSTTASVHNDGHGPYFMEPSIDLGSVKLALTEFKAYEYSFHAPSEHTIDGQVFPLEMQVLHKDAGGALLGLSVLFKIGPSNKFLASLKEAVPDMPRWSMEHGAAVASVSGTHSEFFDLEEILPQGDVHPGGDMTFYNYEGSLTTPPCTGGVDWWVTSTPIDATKEEVNHVRDVILGVEPTKRGNNRDTQPLGERQVLVGHTGFGHHVKLHGHKNDVAPDSRGYNSRDAPWHE